MIATLYRAFRTTARVAMSPTGLNGCLEKPHSVI